VWWIRSIEGVGPWKRAAATLAAAIGYQASALVYAGGLIEFYRQQGMTTDVKARAEFDMNLTGDAAMRSITRRPQWSHRSINRTSDIPKIPSASSPRH
jgi:hypothetical protein